MLFQIVCLLIPAAIANIVPVIARKINFLNYPVDFGFKLGKNRLFGENKTFRGFFFGILFSILVVYLQKLLFGTYYFNALSLVNYNSINFILFGFLIGFSVLFGDLIGSFIKRRFNFKSGESFYFLDQVNSALGLVILFVPFYFTNYLEISFWVLIVWTLGHLIVKYVGYFFGFDDKKV